MIQSAIDQRIEFIERKNQISYDMDHNMKSVNDDYTEEKLRYMLSINDLYVFTNSLWEYSLTVNGTEITSDEIFVSPESGKIEIVLSETLNPVPIPVNIILYGSLTRGDKSDSPFNHINVFNSGEKNEYDFIRR